MNKPYHEMTPAERLAARIAKNREIDQRVQDQRIEDQRHPAKKSPEAASGGSAAKKRNSIGIQAKRPSNALDRFQEIKRTQGIDAASDFVHSRIKSVAD